MQNIDARLINPFLQACTGIVGMVAQMELNIGKPQILDKLELGNLAIKVGVVGELNGNVYLEMKQENAMDIASRMMCGMPVNALDEMSCSALSELGNMIAGNAATIFSSMDILLDITTPTLIPAIDSEHGEGVKGIKVGLLSNGENYLNVCVDL